MQDWEIAKIFNDWHNRILGTEDLDSDNPDGPIVGTSTFFTATNQRNRRRRQGEPSQIPKSEHGRIRLT